MHLTISKYDLEYNLHSIFFRNCLHQQHIRQFCGVGISWFTGTFYIKCFQIWTDTCMWIYINRSKSNFLTLEIIESFLIKYMHFKVYCIYLFINWSILNYYYYRTLVLEIIFIVNTCTSKLFISCLLTNFSLQWTALWRVLDST